MLIANSSWYLLHYRKHLLTRLQHECEHVIALCPVDSATPELSNLVIHIPWRIHRATDAHPLSMVISFLRLIFLVRAIKPRLIHSHTLKANLLASIVSALFGVPCVLSFAGLGRLSRASGLPSLLFRRILLFIIFFSRRCRSSRWNWTISNFRSLLIFQNPVDYKFVKSLLPHDDNTQICIIRGSGLPSQYCNLDVSDLKSRWTSPTISNPHIEPVYCARLLKSKGIYSFLELSQRFTKYTFNVFGSIDPSSSDSVKAQEVSAFASRFSNVRFQGNTKDPLYYFNSNYPVLFVPSQYGEGLPRAVLEALALQIPVVVSSLAASSIFTDDIVYIADDSSLDSYITAFNRLLSDYFSGVLSSRLQRARSFVLEYFTEDLIVHQTFDAYSCVLDSESESYLLSKDHQRFGDWLAQ